MKSVKVVSIPQLTNYFEIYFPIQTIDKVLSIYIAFSSNNTIKRIYRFGGSSINESFTTSLMLSHLTMIQTPSTLWV